MNDMVSDSVVITHDVGLHARPSVALTKVAKGFAAKIEIGGSADGPWIDAKSIVKVMAMKAKQHSTLFVRASGDDAGPSHLATRAEGAGSAEYSGVSTGADMTREFDRRIVERAVPSELSFESGNGVDRVRLFEQ